jgi:dihydrofolate reductase
VLVAAVARNGVIGAQGAIPWRLPEDQARFKAMTMGGTLVMGRKTYESIGRPLPGRTTVVVTRQPGWSAPGVTVAHSVEEALGLVAGTAFVAGGGDVYALTLPVATRLELTEVDAAPDGDAWFPDWDRSAWVVVAREERDGFAFVTYERVGGAPASGGARSVGLAAAERPDVSAEASGGAGSVVQGDCAGARPGRLRRLDQAVGALAGRLLPRRGAAPASALLGTAIGVLLGAGALLVGTLQLDALLWLPAAWAGLGVGLLAVAGVVHVLSTRPAPAAPHR